MQTSDNLTGICRSGGFNDDNESNIKPQNLWIYLS